MYECNNGNAASLPKHFCEKHSHVYAILVPESASKYFLSEDDKIALLELTILRKFRINLTFPASVSLNETIASVISVGHPSIRT